MRTHVFILVFSYICGLVALLDRIQLSFSIIFTFNNIYYDIERENRVYD
jgi:hypothetical protein